MMGHIEHIAILAPYYYLLGVKYIVVHHVIEFVYVKLCDHLFANYALSLWHHRQSSTP